MASETSERMTNSALLAEAIRLLEAAGYTVVRETDSLISVPSGVTLLAEDRFGVVLVVLFDTWSDLRAHWTEAQGQLVNLMSQRLVAAQSKSWEGYLVLLTTALVGPEAREQADRIRYDTSRVRKLLATGENLVTLGDVGQALLPLMPVEPEAVVTTQDGTILDALPNLIAQRGGSGDAAHVLVQAFQEHQPLMDQLHGYLRQ